MAGTWNFFAELEIGSLKGEPDLILCSEVVFEMRKSRNWVTVVRCIKIISNYFSITCRFL